MWETLLTFYLLVGSGLLLKKLRIFSEEDVKVFVHYIIYFALPVTILGIVHEFNFSWKDFFVFGTAWFTIAVTTLFVFGILSKQVRANR